MTSPENPQAAFNAWRQSVRAKAADVDAKFAALVDALEAQDLPPERLGEILEGLRPAADLDFTLVVEAVQELRAETDAYWDAQREEADSQLAGEIEAKAAAAGGRPAPRRRMPTGFAQLDFAERMAKEHGRNFAYGSELGWHRWTGTHWVRDGARDAARRAIIRTIHSTKMPPPETNRAKADGFIAGARELASVTDPIYRPPEDWDRQRLTLLNVLNGTLDLETKRLRKHNPDDLFLGVADVHWTARPDRAAYKVWLDYIIRVVPDEAERSMLQSFLGYCLTGWIMDHHFLMVVGGEGAGKSTLISAISNVMGSLAVNFNSDMLMKRNYQPHKQEWMVFRGKRVAFAAELRKGASMETAKVNLLTGDDRITGNYMRQNDATYRRTHKTVLFGNHRPNFGDVTGDGITRRLALLEVTSIPKEERDTALPGKLADPKVKSAILHWMVEGLSRFIQDGKRLILPASVEARNEEAFEDDDPIGEFLEGLNVIEDPDSHLPSVDLYERYTTYCDQTGSKRISQTALAGKLAKRGWPKPRLLRRGNDVFRGFEGRYLG